MQKRLYGLDLLRSILMLIGVLIHASSIMSSYNSWLYNSQVRLNEISYGVIYITHFFRMETFFLIAGFFSLLVIDRKGYSFFIINRKKRVLIPLISSILTISPIVIYFSIFYNGKNINEINLSNFLMHFWFLLTLFILSLLTYNYKKLICIVSKIFSKIKNFSLVFLVLLSFLNIIIHFIFSKVFNCFEILKFYDIFIFNTLYYGFFYVVGFSFYRFKNLSKNFKFNLFHFLFINLIYIIVFYIFKENIFSDNITKVIKFFYYLTVVVPAYVSSIFLFNFFKNINIGKNKIIELLVDSSIIIYLFHVPVLIYISYYFDNFLNDNFYFFGICIFTYLITFFIYFLIKKNKILKIMYGLK